MKKTFTPEFMAQNCGCYSVDQLAKCSFMNLPEITVESILDSEISTKDKFWFVCKKLATKEENKLIAIGVAEIVLEIFEKKYPDDKRPREAIQAAKDYLAGTINFEELRAKRKDVAVAAAYAADAAAAYAAYAAAADADAVAAAYAADVAAVAADAAYGTDYKSIILQFFKDFTNNLPTE